MTIKEFTAAAIKFSAESAEWGGLDQYKFYTTSGNSAEWVETCDNCTGGLDLSWAFHEPAEWIAAEAPQRYADQIANLLEQGIDEAWDAEQLTAVLDLMH